MTIDKSLRIRRGSVKSRNVLKRGERITKLKEAERWEETMTVLGLPKVKVTRLTMKKKKKKKEEEAGAEALPPLRVPPHRPLALRELLRLPRVPPPQKPPLHPPRVPPRNNYFANELQEKARGFYPWAFSFADSFVATTLFGSLFAATNTLRNADALVSVAG